MCFNFRGLYTTSCHFFFDPNPACVFLLCTRRSCVAVEYCWLAVKVACCSAECLDVSSILQNAPVITSGAVATVSAFLYNHIFFLFPHMVMDDKCDFH